MLHPCERFLAVTRFVILSATEGTDQETIALRKIVQVQKYSYKKVKTKL